MTNEDAFAHNIINVQEYDKLAQYSVGYTPPTVVGPVPAQTQFSVQKALDTLKPLIHAHDVATQSHYTALSPEPIEVIKSWGLDYLEGNVLKYLARYRRKNGVEDLRKAAVYLNWLIEREESNEEAHHRTNASTSVGGLVGAPRSR